MCQCMMEKLFCKAEIAKTRTDIFVAESADVVGDVQLERDSSVWYQAVIRGDHDKICVGAESNIQDGCVLHADEGFPVQIGKQVTVGHGAIIHGCEIGDGTLVGMGAIVLNGAKIGKNCVIGAGALITQGMVIPDGMMALGCPAKIRRAVTKEEIEENLKNTMDYVRLGRQYAAQKKEVADFENCSSK